MNAALQIASGQSLGQRERQEDRVGTTRTGDGAQVMVLADGMGGHAGGDVAAELAVETFLSAIEAASTPEQALAKALSAANARIGEAVAADHDLDGMGCTLVAAVVTRNRLRWISVGDSQLLLLRRGELRRLNADHSMREILDGMVKAGRLSAEDAARDPQRNALRSAVSGEQIDLIDAPDATLALEDGDVVLLASDGIETLEPSEIAHVAMSAARGGARKIVDRLLGAVQARRRKHQDNTSIIAYLQGAAGKSRSRKGVIAAAIFGLTAALFGGALLMWSTHGPAAAGGATPKDAKHEHR